MKESIASRVMGYVGLSGSPVPTGSVAPRVPSPFTQDILTKEFNDFGQVVNPETWTRFGNLMNRPTTFTAMLDLWEQMSLWDLLAAALVQIVDEACQTDPADPGTLWFECDDGKAEEEVNNMLENINMEEILPSQVWYTASLGNSFDKIDYARGEGVMNLSFVHPQRVRRYWLKRNRQCIGFKWADETPNKEDLYVQGNQTVQRMAVGNNQDADNLWYPWDFLHMRRMYRMRESEHGEPIFEEAQGIYKKLRIALDQMVVHRAQVQPDRYVAEIDVQEQPPADQLRTVQRWKQQLRSKLSFGPNDNIDDFKSFYNAMGLDSILYIARPKGYQHALNKLAGTANVPDVYDVEMLTNLFFSVIGMPKQWLGIGQAEGGPTSGRALLAQDIRFLRKIKSIRKPITNAYTWLGYFHLILKGHDVSKLTLKARMSDIGSLEDQLKIETLKTQVETLNELADVMDKFKLPREAWVEVVFRRYMRLPDEIINVFLTALPTPVEAAESRKSVHRSTSVTQILRELDSKIGNNPRAGFLIESLKKVVNGRFNDSKDPDVKLTRSLVESIGKMPVIQPDDLVISSFGRDPFKLNESADKAGGKGWRRYNYAA
jgi:hypothetical protein